MTFIDPVLFSSGKQVNDYKEKRVKDWETMKGESYEDFDHYFEEIMSKWNIDFGDEESTQTNDGSSQDSEDTEDEVDDLSGTDSQSSVEDNNSPEEAGVYFPNDANIKIETGLTKEERRYIEAIALMEWNFMIMNRRANQKTQKKIIKKEKKEKKELEIQEMTYQAKLEAQYRSEEKARRNKKKQGG